MQRETNFLGYIISQDGVHVDLEKTAVVEQWNLVILKSSDPS